MRFLNRAKAAANEWYRISIKAAANEAEVMIYDEIGIWGITAQQFVSDLNKITTKTIHVRLNSPGGDFFDGMAIVNAFRSHPSEIVIHVDALAASVAASIAVAGDRVIMADNAYLMIHDPYVWGMVGGAEELRKQADLLDKLSETIANDLAEVSGKSVDEIKAAMKAETWYSASEAKDAGLVDEVEKLASVQNRAFDLSEYGFRNVPVAFKAQAAPAPEQPAKPAENPPTPSARPAAPATPLLDEREERFEQQREKLHL